MSKQSLRIGITCYPTFGGSGVIAAEIGMAMARRGHRVHFICLGVPQRLERFMENIFFHEVEILDYPLFTYPPYSVNLASKMVEVTTYENLDILHVHYAVPHATSAYLAAQVLGENAPKVITTLHGTDITLVGHERTYLPITRFSIFQSDGVTAPSHYLKHATYDKLNLSTMTPIEVIPNFVDIMRFFPAEHKSLELVSHILGSCPKGSQTKTLIHVSNFRPVKRVDDVVQIFSQVRKSVDCRLVLIGDGPERSRIERMVWDMSLSEHVCFLGKQESFVQVLQQADLFLLPSASESFGLAALEAMSCGVPVIASNVHGIPEVVVDGQTGYLSDVGDIDDMARNAVSLLLDSEKHKRFSESARQRAISEFSHEEIISRYERYYYEILSQAPPGKS